MNKKTKDNLLFNIPVMTMMILSTIGLLILSVIAHVEGLSSSIFYTCVVLIFVYASVIALMVRQGFKILLEEIENKNGS